MFVVNFSPVRKDGTDMDKMTTAEAVKALTAYGLRTGLIEKTDIYYVSNSLFDVLKFDPETDFNPNGGQKEKLEDILRVLLDDAEKRGIIESGNASRDLFDTKLMGCLTPRPSEFLKKFNEDYAEDPCMATDYFYRFSCDSDYIRRYRIVKDRKWITPTQYGDIDITINLSKPEKDPKAIAAALTKQQKSYPADLLCHENEGYAGNLNHPARETLRQVPLTLSGERWYMQYSPYVYYNEHCIVLSDQHRPMKIEKATFERLLAFIDIFPHYMIGSNADLPIVGGSILTHEHFQGGRYEFAMAKSHIRKEIEFKGYKDVKAGIVNWPMSVIRLDASDKNRLVELSSEILSAWRCYSDPIADILSSTDGVLHNTITPIARKRNDLYEMDLVLRNNRTTKQYPLGIFHPHQEKHHIKKENIGLIEVMGMAILPARLLKEMTELKKAILSGSDIHSIPDIASHADWAEGFLKKYDTVSEENIDEILHREIGLVFLGVLEDAGVFKDTETGHAQFDRFIKSL
jgi:UDPglucose--hexose-1-phosphate uridylyltransferase